MYKIWLSILHLFLVTVQVNSGEYFTNEYNKGLIMPSSLPVPSSSEYYCALLCVKIQRCSAASFNSSTQQCLLDHLGGAGYPDFINSVDVLFKRQGNRVTIQTPDLYKYIFLDDYNLELRGTFLKFSVKSCSNAILGLFTEIGDHNLNMYEIVIGGAGNTDSGIRRGKMQPNQVTHYESILSCTEHRNLWISWRNGKLCVGKGEETTNTSTIFLEWVDPDPLDIKMVGILTGWGATGDWIF